MDPGDQTEDVRLYTTDRCLGHNEASHRLPNEQSLGWYGTATQHVLDMGTIKTLLRKIYSWICYYLSIMYSLGGWRLEAGGLLVWGSRARHCLWKQRRGERKKDTVISREERQAANMLLLVMNLLTSPALLSECLNICNFKHTPVVANCDSTIGTSCQMLSFGWSNRSEHSTWWYVHHHLCLGSLIRPGIFT